MASNSACVTPPSLIPTQVKNKCLFWNIKASVNKISRTAFGAIKELPPNSPPSPPALFSKNIMREKGSRCGK